LFIGNVTTDVFPGSKYIESVFAAGTQLGAAGAYSVPPNPLLGFNEVSVRKQE